MGEPVQLIALTYTQARLTYLALPVAVAHLIRDLTFRASPDLDRPGGSASLIALLSCQGPLWMEMEKPAFAQMARPAQTIATAS